MLLHISTDTNNSGEHYWKLNFKTSLLCMGYVPQKFAIATDNGSGFTSATFNEFINHNGIKHVCQTQKFSLSKGLAIGNYDSYV